MISLNLSGNYARLGGGIFIDRENSYVVILDNNTYSQIMTIESNHIDYRVGYDQEGGCDNLGGTDSPKNITVYGAKEFIVFFDAMTDICGEDLLSIRANENIIHITSDTIPGINLPPLIVPGDHLSIDLTCRSNYCSETYGVKINIIPVMNSTMDSRISKNVAGENGGGVYVNSNNNL